MHSKIFTSFIFHNPIMMRLEGYKIYFFLFYYYYFFFMRYASRAKLIKNKPKINEDPKDALIKQM